MEEEDERRETAIASTPSLQPNFKPVGVTPTQLAKFQELHRRRLKIRTRSKIKKKSKGVVDATSKSHGKNSDDKDWTEENFSNAIENSSVSISKGSNIGDLSSLQQDNVAPHFASKNRQKLHWGLDTKERWERKSNM